MSELSHAIHFMKPSNETPTTSEPSTVEELNALVKRIKDAGGIVIPEPLFKSDGSENKAGVDALFDALDSGIPPEIVKHVRAFALAILHGDETHQTWLLEAAEAYVMQRALPPPRSGATK